MTLAISDRASGTLPSNTETYPEQHIMATSVLENEIIEDLSMKAQKKKLKELFAKFIDIFRKFHANIPLPEATSQIPIHAKFLNEVLLKK